MKRFLPNLTGHATFEGHCRSGVENDLAHGSTLRSWSRGGSKSAFSFVFHFAPKESLLKFNGLDLASKSSIILKMNSKHRKTLEVIRSKPERGDIAWAAVEALLQGIGCRKLEGEGSRVRFVSPEGEILRIHRPHPRSVLDKGAVKSVRRFLDQMEIEE